MTAPRRAPPKPAINSSDISYPSLAFGEVYNTKMRKKFCYTNRKGGRSSNFSRKVKRLHVLLHFAENFPKNRGPMRAVYFCLCPCFFAMVILISTLATSQTLTVPQAITDPKQIASKPDARVEKSLSIEKLYMTRQVGGSTWSPDGKWIAYMSDYDGDEQWDIFLVSPKSGQVVNLTHTREIAEQSPAWSPDGRFLAYMVKPRTSSVFEIDVYDTVLREVKHLTTGTAKDRMNVAPIWSADGEFIVYTQEQSKGTDSNIFLVDVASAQSTLLTPHDGEYTYSANDVSPDGKNVLITSSAGDGYDNVGLLEIASKKIRWLTNDKWEVSGESFSPDGKSLTYTANVDGNTDIYL